MRQRNSKRLQLTMKTRLIILSVISSLTVFSQTESSADRKVAYGLSITPEFNSLIAGNPVGQESVKSQLGFSAGFNVEFQLSKKSSIRTGIGYGLKNYEHTQSGLIFGSDINPVTGVVSESKLESKIAFSELQIPLIFKYEFKENKFFVTGGMEFIYPFANNSERVIYYGTGNTEKLSNSNNTKSVNLAPVISLGYNFTVSDKLSISIEPMFKYYLKEYIIIESNLYNYGLKTTLNF